jgi:membrane protein implicated in regulation of membrane protease activity
MQWWAWITIGAILLGAELAFVDAQFYLVFIGLSALIVGLLDVTGVASSPALQWIVFALLAGVSMLAFRKPIYGLLRRQLPVMNAGPAGDTVTCPSDLPPGGACRLEYRGSSWSVVNGGAAPIIAGSRARIDRVDGLTLVVHGDA